MGLAVDLKHHEQVLATAGEDARGLEPAVRAGADLVVAGREAHRFPSSGWHVRHRQTRRAGSRIPGYGFAGTSPLMIHDSWS